MYHASDAHQDFLAIENHGIIGNTHTIALVGIDGRIDWFCYPHFDSPSVFGSILDDKIGGEFRIAPVCYHRQSGESCSRTILGSERITSSTGNTTSENAVPSCEVRQKQFYWPETNVLVTRFFEDDGVAQIVDYMPIGLASNEHGYDKLIRKVHVIRGKMSFFVDCWPAFNYARSSHKLILTPTGAIFEEPQGPLVMELISSVPLEQSQYQQGGVSTTFTLKEGETAVFSFGEITPPEKPKTPTSEKQETTAPCGNNTSTQNGFWLTPQREEELFTLTVNYWRSWLKKCCYKGRWREQVHRSALVLKLLCFDKTGAIIASPTCSLPHIIGGNRNYDYRHMWLRDTAFALYALLRIGFTDEATQFMQWLEARCAEDIKENGKQAHPLQFIYAIDGVSKIYHQQLDHLSGYKNSKPVNVGLDLENHFQIDVLGDLMDAVYLYNKYGTQISYDMWSHLSLKIDWLCDNWQHPDEGIWQLHEEPRRQFVYSKVMCWVAMDRALRLADRRSFPAPNRDKWFSVRDQIQYDIMKNAWSEERQAFVQSYGSKVLDSAILIMPLVFFMAPSDPRMLKTIERIMKPPKEGGLLVESSLVFRYESEATKQSVVCQEGTFNVCSFWLIEALTRAGKKDPKKLQTARLMFEEMLGHGNHLGLYSEETGPCGEHLGNFPQTLSHLAQISAAFNLNRSLPE